MLRFPYPILAAVVLVSSACQTRPKPARAIGVAYLGSAGSDIRKDLAARSPSVGKLKFGDRVEVLQARRLMLKVRTREGVEGWLDGRNLLTASQMRELERMAAWAARLPSHGRATVYDSLNVHTDPHRQAPALYRIPPGGSVEVLSLKTVPRTRYQPLVTAIYGGVDPTAVAQRRRKESGKKRRVDADNERRIETPPFPSPPKPPENWQELSRVDWGEQLRPAVGMDYWALVRTPNGKAGWVLARMLVMAIPDEVAQYADGHRITSYFSLGEAGAGQQKNHWLWTTLSQPFAPIDFDSFRVFVYNLKRNRYETAYIERGLRGHFPVVMQTVEVTENRVPTQAPGFSVVTEDENGQWWKRTFAFQGYRVRLVRREAVSKPGLETPPLQHELPAVAPDPPKSRSLWTRLKSILSR